MTWTNFNTFNILFVKDMFNVLKVDQSVVKIVQEVSNITRRWLDEKET